MRSVDMALDAALLVMQNGGSTVAADRTFSNVLKGCGTDGVAAVWRLDFVALRAQAESDLSPVIRPVGKTEVNLLRESEAIVLAERLARREIAAADFGEELERIKKLPSPYNRWVMIAAAACAAGSFSRVAGGDWGSFGIGFVAAAVGQFFRSMLHANKVAVAPVTLVCGALSAFIAGAGLHLGYSQVGPATLIASVVYMVPGLPLINGLIDMVSHKYLLVGIERMLNAAFLFLVLAIAIAIADALIL